MAIASTALWQLFAIAQMDDFGERVRKAAERIGGLNALSKKSGVKRRTLGNWLAGTRPKAEDVRRLAEALDTSVDYLMGLPGATIDEVFVDDQAAASTKASERAGVQSRPSNMASSGHISEPDQTFDRGGGVDVVLLQRLGDIVEAVFAECKQTPPPRALMLEAGRLYNELTAMAKDPTDIDVVNALLPVLRQRFKERLLSAEPGSGKRSAS